MAQKPQKSFNGGIISPRLWQQVDIVKYQSGLATCENMIPIKEGAIVRRPGTEFITEVKDSRKARLFSFEFSDADTYIMELSATTDADEAVFRYFRNGKLIEAKKIDCTFDGSQNKILSSITPESEYEGVRFRKGTGALPAAIEEDKNYFVRTLVKNTSFQISDKRKVGSPIFAFTGNGTPGTFYYGRQLEETQGAGIIYETKVKKYVEDDLFKINSLQNFDRYFLFINKYQTQLLTRYDHADWGILDDAWTSDDYFPPMFPSRADPDTDVKVYANIGIFFQNRLFLGGFAEEPPDPLPDPAPPLVLHPALIMGSRTNGEYNFKFETGDVEAAISYEILVTDYNFLQWFNVVKNQLLIGTSNSERLMRGSSTGAITGSGYDGDDPVNPPEFLMNSAFGSSEVIAEPIGDTIVAAQAPGFKLRNYSYEFERDKYVGVNLNRLTEHLTRSSTVKQLAYQENPEQILWVLRNNGILQSLTYVPEEEVFAWAVQEISDGVDRQAFVESIEVIPTADDEDEIWLVVKRLINGVTKRYVERFTKQFRANLQILPSFSPPWGDGFDAPLLVTLIKGSAAGNLYYTLDGSEPSPFNGMVYATPFYIENPTKIKVADDAGNIVTGIYNFAGDRLHDSEGDPLFDAKQPPPGDPLYAVASTEPPQP